MPDVREKPAGRPRQAGHDERIVRAAQECFSENGWAGLTFEAVARRAGVGKPAVYRRWDSRRELLTAAAEALPQIFAEDHGSLEADLRHVFSQIFDSLLGYSGPFWARLQLEVGSTEELHGFFQSGILEEPRSTYTELGARAVARGELSKLPPISLLMELGNGTITMHVAHTPSYRRAEMIERRDAYVARLARWVTVALLDTDTASPSAG